MFLARMGNCPWSKVAQEWGKGREAHWVLHGSFDPPRAPGSLAVPKTLTVTARQAALHAHNLRHAAGGVRERADKSEAGRGCTAQGVWQA